MKEAVTKVIDTLTQEDFHGAFQKLLEQYNKCIATGGDYFEGDERFIFETLVPFVVLLFYLSSPTTITNGVSAYYIEQILLYT